jgi:small subunit ribosomal protein S29
MGDSKYTALNEEEKLKPIHAHDLVQVKHFIDHLSGQRELKNGGMVLAATSLSEHIKSAALDVSIQAVEARQTSESEIRVSDFYDPYQKLDMRALRALTADFSTSNSNSTEASETPAEGETTDTKAIVSKNENGLGVIRLSGITKPEAKNILEYWATSGMVRRQVEEKFVADTWTVSGGGVLREMEKGCLRRVA